VSLISDVVPLKKMGATWKGLCPFHQERTPSFNVNGDKGFFKCFGCGAGGDAVKFVELQQKVSFPEGVRYLAQRAGMTVPEGPGGQEDRAAAAEREALIKLHEDAAAFFREMLDTPAGARARRSWRPVESARKPRKLSDMATRRPPAAIHWLAGFRTGRFQ
jgi:DNA primase